MLNGDWGEPRLWLAVVLVLVLAAFITPSTDVFTMLLVALPLWLLYESSIIVVRHAERRLAPPIQE